MTGIDIVMAVYHMVNTPAVRTLLGSGKVWQHNRPANSPYPDVVVSIPIFEGNSRSVNYVDVNIHTPNLPHFEPIPGHGEDHTFPDLQLHKNILDAVLPLIQSVPGVWLRPAILGVPVRDADGHWFTTIRVSMLSLNENAAVSATLERITSVPDGYGGHAAAYSVEWTGLAERIESPTGNQMELRTGRLDLNARAQWRIPASSVAPQKYHRLATANGIYNIDGITPEGGVFWLLNTTRKDGWN